MWRTKRGVSVRHRSFTDRTGTGWTVSEVTKGLPTFPARRAPRAFALWLCFESSGESRRLAPVPAKWDDLPADGLEGLLGASDLMPIAG